MLTNKVDNLYSTSMYGLAFIAIICSLGAILASARHGDGSGLGQFILDMITSTGGTISTTPHAVCNTVCFSQTASDYMYDYCVYSYTTSGQRCTFSVTQELRDGIVNAIQVNQMQYGNLELIGSCMTIFNSGSTVAYVKYVRSGSDIYLNALQCEAESRWGVPSPLFDTNGTAC